MLSWCQQVECCSCLKTLKLQDWTTTTTTTTTTKTTTADGMLLLSEDSEVARLGSGNTLTHHGNLHHFETFWQNLATNTSSSLAGHPLTKSTYTSDPISVFARVDFSWPTMFCFSFAIKKPPQELCKGYQVGSVNKFLESFARRLGSWERFLRWEGGFQMERSLKHDVIIVRAKKEASTSAVCSCFIVFLCLSVSV